MDLDAAVRADPVLRRVTVVVGVIFLVACLPKFLAYGWERDAFVRFDLPAPGFLVVVAGVVELVGGALLVAGRLVLPSCVVLTATMLVAFVAGGILAGDEIPSLTLAPALIVAMGWLVLRGAPRPARPGSPDGAPDRSAPPASPDGPVLDARRDGALDVPHDEAVALERLQRPGRASPRRPRRRGGAGR